MQHISDDLPRLLTGDATRDVVLEAARHLRICVDCQQELVAAVIAHASLTAAHRFAPEIVSPDSADDESAHIFEFADVAPLPDMSTVFAGARAEASPPAATPLPTSASTYGRPAGPGEGAPAKVHHLRRRVLAVAAAAAVVTGAGVTYAAIGTADGSHPVTRTVALEGTTDSRDGKVVLVGNTRMRIDASALPTLDAAHQYEVWLTDDTGQEKQSVGFLDTPDRTKELMVPSKLMSQYNNIAVSVQRVKQTEYSGITVLHGAYG